MNSIRSELRAICRLAGPAVVTQVGTMLMGVVDTLMVARVGAEALGAAAIANVWLSLALYCSMGILFGLDPIVSQAHGRRDGPRAGLALQHGCVLAAALTVPVALLFAMSGPALVALGQQPALARAASEYLIVQIPGIAPLLLYVALRQYLQGRTLVQPALWTMVWANAVNVVANWALIFGHLGFPAWGLWGAGVATTAVRVFLFGTLVGWVWWRELHRGAWRPWSRLAISRRELTAVLALGLPVWLQMLLEIGAFSGSSLIVGWLGTEALAGHAIALNLASLAFMVPLGVSIAASTRVGNLVGAGDLAGVRRASRLALALGAGVMTVSGVCFVFLPLTLAGFYSADPAVLAVCAVLLPIAGAFQLFDGTQVVACGVLRGMGHTRPAAWASFLGYWVLALPLGVGLALGFDAGVAGIWWGFLAGLAAVAVGLVVWILKNPVPIGPRGDAPQRPWAEAARDVAAGAPLPMPPLQSGAPEAPRERRWR